MAPFHSGIGRHARFWPLADRVQSGELIEKVPGGHKGHITDLQFSPDRTYFITASKDKFAKVKAFPLFNLTVLLDMGRRNTPTHQAI